jgi:hypothetical protein
LALDRLSTYDQKRTLLTFEAGDVIRIDTDGVPENIKPGDTLKIEIRDISVLWTKAVAAK